MENEDLTHLVYTTTTPPSEETTQGNYDHSINTSMILLSNVIDPLSSGSPNNHLQLYNPLRSSLLISQGYCNGGSIKPTKEYSNPYLEEDFNFDILNWDIHMANIKIAPCRESFNTFCAALIDDYDKKGKKESSSGGSVAPSVAGGSSGGGGRVEMGNWNGKFRSRTLGFDEISKYFYMTINDAAKELNVGLTLLKKRCRELGIPRWPHRKMKSLNSLIHNIQALENERKGECMPKEIMTLKEHKKLMEKMPQLELSERAKRLRQACFKANYKKRRAMLSTS